MQARRLLAVHALFLLSGVSGLVYQVVWVREFGNIFGNTVYSASLVTAVFMFGLGVGSWVAGEWADRARARGLSPTALVRAYGTAELSIGALGAAIAAILPALGDYSARLSTYAVGPHGWSVLSPGSHALRYLVATLLLSPPTMLMGATLTLLIRHIVHVREALDDAGWKIGALYAANTAGAALGCLLTDWLLIPQLGLLRTQLIAAGLNAGVGLFAFTMGGPQPGPAAPPEAEDTSSSQSGKIALTGLALAFSGLAAMGLEVLWFRFIISAIGSYRAVFSLMLAVILLGTVLGSLAGGAIQRRIGRPAEILMATQAILILSALLLLATFDRTLPERELTEAFVANGMPPGGLSRWVQSVTALRTIVSLIGVPVLLMGFSFPLANANIQSVAGRVGGRAGLLYLANTAGAVLGSVLTGFVFLPHLGSQGAALVLGCFGAGSILPLHLSARSSGGKRSDYIFILCSAVLFAALLTWRQLPGDFLIERSLPALAEGESRLDVSEGPVELLAVVSDARGDLALQTNGHPMSGTNLWAQRYMRAFVHLPLLNVEAPKSVLVICFGVGNTLSATTLYPSLQRIDIADLSANVLEHAHFFSATNHDVLSDPRVHVHLNDGRQHLRMMPEKTYDLITLEPPPIAFAGLSALYSREFYQLAKSRLADGGYLSQWLPIYQLPGPVVLQMVRAFRDVFPNAMLLSGSDRELILVGRRDASTAISLARVEQNLRANPAVAEDLRRVQLGNITEIVGTFVADPDTLHRATRDAAPITDDRPTMEYAILSKVAGVRIPAELFEPDHLPNYCPDCFQGGKPVASVSDIGGYLGVLKRYYQSDDFLNYTGVHLPPKGDRQRIAQMHGAQESIGKSSYLTSLFSPAESVQ